MNKFRRFISIVIVTALIFNMPMSILAGNEGIDNGIFLIESSVAETSGKIEEIETTHAKEFIEETKEGQSIVEYEREKLRELEEELENDKIDSEKVGSNGEVNLLESAIAEKMSKDLSDEISTTTAEETNTKETTIDVLDNEADTENISTFSEIENIENTDLSNIIEENESIATTSEPNKIKVSVSEGNIFGAGNHTSTANPRVVINSTYDRYDIYTGENAGVVQILDDNDTYYNGNTNVKVIRDMIDAHNNSPILLKLSANVQFFSFDNQNDNYVLLPSGYVEDLVARESGNGYLNPQGINALDHISINLTFNTTDLGTYDLFEYGVLYYLSCYEGVLGEYYYYNPSNTDIDRAASFYVNNRIMDRTYNIVSEYFYKSPSGENLSFKPTWLVNNDNLTGANKETYAKQ